MIEYKNNYEDNFFYDISVYEHTRCKLFKKLGVETNLDIHLFITDLDFDNPRISCLIAPKYFHSKYLSLHSFD